MHNPKVTIMIPTYNQSAYICRALKSALNQTYENLEIIISDDFSSDETEQVVNSLLKSLSDQRIIYKKHSHNLGILRNYCETLGNATGELVVNLDGDDFLLAQRLSKEPSLCSPLIRKSH